MDTLMDALTRYTDENLMLQLLQETAPQTKAAWCRVEELTNRLNALGPEAEKWTEELRDELVTIDFHYEQAVLRAGISIGLELGRL